MSTLAAKGSRAIIGLSGEHSERAAEQFSALDTPIQTITSGVHPTAWLAEATQGLFNAHLPGWRTHIADPSFWASTVDIPTQALIATRRALRSRLIDAIRSHTGDPNLLDADRLTLGLAGSFTSDRRANLIFTQPERLAAFLDRGAQIIFAGKANPEDAAGQAILEEVIQRSQEPELVGRIVFVPDYDPHWSRLLTQGCDVWVHHPRASLQACGTTGQRAALNGNPNLSLLTGWWKEGADGTNGWSLQNLGDIEDAMELYEQLEGPVWSAFKDDEAWAQIMRRTLTSCVPAFNSERMVRDFCSQVYEPEAP
jgi:starch phosphorylase